MRFARFTETAWFSGTLLVLAATLHGSDDSNARSKPPSLASRGTSTVQRDPLSVVFERASAAQHAKDFKRALSLFQEAAALADRRSRPMSWLTCQFNICHTLNLQGDRTRAAAVARQIVRDCESSYGSGDPLTSEALAHLAFVLKQHGNLAAAEPVYRRNVRLLESKYGSDHYLVANAICRHGNLLQSLGRLDEAENQLRRALAIAMDSTAASGDPADLCFYLTHLGYCLHTAKKTAEARNLMDTAYSIVESQEEDIRLKGSILRRQAEYFRDVRMLDRAEQVARRGLLRLARLHDVNRAKFFYYDVAAEIYRSVLRAKEMTESRIAAVIAGVEQEGARFQRTAGMGPEGATASDAAQ